MSKCDDIMCTEEVNVDVHEKEKKKVEKKKSRSILKSLKVLGL